MKIKHGNTRFVILIGSLAIKIAKINPIRAMKTFYHYVCYQCQYPNKNILFKSWNWNYRYMHSIAYCLFRGIAANLWERRLYRETNDQFLMPTYFSLLGFVNIQRAGSPLEMQDVDCWCQIVGLTSQEEAFCDSHLFSDHLNFCWVGNRLMIADYGNDMCHDFLRKYGTKLHEEFSLDYSWEVEKIKLND